MRCQRCGLTRHETQENTDIYMYTDRRSSVRERWTGATTVERSPATHLAARDVATRLKRSHASLCAQSTIHIG